MYNKITLVDIPTKRKVGEIIPGILVASGILDTFTGLIVELNSINDNYINEKVYPVKAVKYIKENIDINNMKIYNKYNFGSYLILNNIKVFVDFRADLYTSSYNPEVQIKDTFEYEKVKVYHRDIFEKYKLNYALVYNNSAIYIALSNDSGFKDIYKDEDFTLF